MKMKRYAALLAGAWLALSALAAPAHHAQAPTAGAVADGGYQLPSPELQAVVDAPRPPQVRLGPLRKTALLLQMPGLPGIADVAQPELKLAGLRINPRMHAASRFDFAYALTVLDLGSGNSRAVSGLPNPARIADVQWSPNEQWIAVSLWRDEGVELWLVDARRAQARRLIAEELNAVTGSGFSWVGSERLLVRLWPIHPKPAPRPTALPGGPNTQESRPGRAAQNRTYPDLLKTRQDADLLDWYLQSQLAWVSVYGALDLCGPVSTLYQASASPDGQWILATQLRRPYSYLLPIDRFAQTVEIWTDEGVRHKLLAERPLRERLPAGNDAVQTGPREFGWRGDRPATLYWLEAQAGGDPEVNAKVHDLLMQQTAPFDKPGSKVVELAWRFAGVQWGNEHVALVSESWWKTRDTRTWKIDPALPGGAPELLVARKSEDQYAHPGTPLMSSNAWGRSVLRFARDGRSIFLAGQGASAEGDRPFLDRLDLRSKSRQRLWRAQPPYYEEPLSVLDDEGQRLLTSRESSDEPPNLFVRELAGKPALTALTHVEHPLPQFKGIQKQQIRYRRADGVELTATLYLPAGYEPRRDGPRPALLWAYPREYKTAEAASQVQGSPYRFNRVSYNGPLVMLAKGYVVLDGPGMPIVGEGRKEPNDSFLEQLKWDAQAAVDEIVEMGVADRNRIAIGGHSYGAFMTANLLAHTRLFRAGIARSGAYNRTLTPFGFQSEDRNFWQARRVYQDMSPFNFANQIKDPLLLIHGEQDNNPGTFPMQSERLFQALQGLGTPARLVMLPSESHSYRARESVLHMLWEEERWLDTYVKNARIEEENGH